MIIYAITNTLTKKQYVGKTKLTIPRRMVAHYRSAFDKDSPQHIHRAMRFHGREAFTVEELDRAQTLAELSEKEVYWIDKLNTFHDGYNMTLGGDGSNGRVLSDETKERIRQKALDRTPEQREKYRVAQLGKVHTDEAKEKCRQHMMGRRHAVGMTYIHTDEAKEAIRQARLGKKMSDDSRAKLSASKMGKKMGKENPMASAESRRKVALSKLGRKRIYREDGSFYMGSA